jgi:ATP-dependent Clp protease ATP-binding subunit ClpA
MAEHEACALGHTHLGTEHLLLGLVHDGACAAGRAFAALGVSYDDARARVMTIVPGEPMSRSEPVAFTQMARKLLKLSAREALQQSHAQIGTADLTLALLGLHDSSAVRVLDDLGVDRTAARARVLEMASDTVESTTPQVRRVVISPQLSPQAQRLMRHALRLGSSYVARRYMPSTLVRHASTTARFVRSLDTHRDSLPTLRSQFASSAAQPAIPDPRHEVDSRPSSTRPLVAATCVVCSKPSPDCGTLYVTAHDTLICEHCIGEVTSTLPRQPPECD